MKQIFTVFLISSVLAGCASTGGSREPKDQESLKEAARINTDLGAGYLKQGNLQRANTKLEKALQQDSDYPEAHSTYALLLTRLGEIKKAEKHFKIALRKDPLNSASLNNYGTFLCEQGRIEESLEKFTQALKDPLYRTPEYAYTNAGACMMKQKQYERAESYFRRALKVNPKYHGALYQMAIVNELRHQYPLAWAYIERYHSTGRKTADSLWLAVRLARRLQNRDGEAKFSTLLKNRYPDSEQTAEMMSRFK